MEIKNTLEDENLLLLDTLQAELNSSYIQLITNTSQQQITFRCNDGIITILIFISIFSFQKEV